MHLSYFSQNFQLCHTEGFNRLIEAYCHEGNAQKSLGLHDKMLKLGCVPNGLTCKHLVNGLLRSTNSGSLLLESSSAMNCYV